MQLEIFRKTKNIKTNDNTAILYCTRYAAVHVTKITSAKDINSSKL